ncbi:type II secretion system protein GspJ [Simiduia curdlanivorans]|uniref:Type II secretion system protein J n=1 Tax=Simiduia curdlanivorans TaxID=1492769 RepID=A0ABV8UZR0_9GAMM|nr:type II secretion system protein GspJ [Simiduia curdlanivorans]MDN3638054.1 type II secretion system protein GspJ [Simiduia curdlanivorans]
MNSCNQRWRRNTQLSAAGFTLVEVLIAIFITAIIATLAVQTLGSATVSMERGKSLGDQLSEVERLFSLIEQDLRSVRVGRKFEFIGEEVSQSLAGAEETKDDSFQGYGEVYETRDLKQQRKNLLESLDTDHRLLRLVRADWVNFGQAQRSDLQHVTYAWHQGAIWRFFRPIDSEIFGDNPITDEVYIEDVSLARRIISDVNNVTFKYLVPGSPFETESSWSNVWPTTATRTSGPSSSSLPQAVEVVLELKELGEIKRVFLLGVDG